MLNVLRKIVQDVTQEGSFAASVQLLAVQIKEALGTEGVLDIPRVARRWRLSGQQRKRQASPVLGR